MSQLDARNTPQLVGATIDLNRTMCPDSERNAESRGQGDATLRHDALLFGETQHRVIVTCAEPDAAKMIERAKLMGVAAQQIGTVGGDALNVKAGAVQFSAPVRELHDRWWNAIAHAMA
jgi:phosphoribosylformylglycinamidine synthase